MSSASVRPILIGALATVATSLPVFLVSAMAVRISADLGFGIIGIGAAASVFFGSVALSSVMLGRAADRLGSSLGLRIAVLGTAVSMISVATVVSGWLSLAGALVLGGLSSALAQPAANRLLVRTIRPDRLGTAFGLKQSAPPLASMLAGFAVPGIAVTVGWRWGFGLAAGAAILVGAAVRPARARGARPSAGESGGRAKVEPLQPRRLLLVLAGSFGLAFVASSVILTYFVESAVRSGSTESQAGVALAVASITTVVVRVVAGLACDHFRVRPLHLSSALLLFGSLGVALLSLGTPLTTLVGGVAALSGTWGFPGLFWYGLVRAYSDAPGRITGLMAPATAGGVVGPLLFGMTVVRFGYQQAWLLMSAIALIASLAIHLGGRQLHEANTPSDS